MRRGVAPSGLICTDDEVTRGAVRAMMARRGFTVVAEVDSAAAAIEAAARWSPEVAVVDLAVTAGLGLGILARLLGVAPRCAVVVLSDFPGLDLAALEAGAAELVAEHDLRGLDRCLRRLSGAGVVGSSGPG